METEQLKQSSSVKTLPYGWEARLGLNGRVYYHNFCQQSVHILPPPKSWSCAYNLPYGWELGQDGNQKDYFINHILHETTFDDPRTTIDGSCATPSEHPHPRQYTLTRNEQLGFGFIAGSYRPMVVRSVTPGGPADGKLLPGDQIINIGNQFVADSPRENVLDLIRNSATTVTLTVVQPVIVSNSCFLKRNKKSLKGMNRPRVRFSETDDESEFPRESSLTNGPDELRIFLEEGNPRTFRFDNNSTIGDVIEDLCKDLDLREKKHYSLVLVPEKSRNVLDSSFFDDVILPAWELVSQVLANPNYKYHQCHLRLAFVPKDVHQLSRNDPSSFDYLYHQCINDVVSGTVFDQDQSSEELLQLASLQVLVLHLTEEMESFESVRSSRKKKLIYSLSKLNIKRIEKDYTLEKFFPRAMIEIYQKNLKESRKAFLHHVKVNHENYVVKFISDQQTPSTGSPSTRQPELSLDPSLTRLKMQYIKTIYHYHMYGGRYFEATIVAVVDTDVTLLAGHHYGISQLINKKTKMSSSYCDFTSIEQIEVAPPKPNRDQTNVRVELKDMAPLVMAMNHHSALNFAHFVSGYCRLYKNEDVMLTLPLAEQKAAPDYNGLHDVKPSDWNYPPDVDSSSMSCDFSDPMTFSLLSEEIPLSVRAMFQQCKPVEEEEEEISSSSDEDVIDSSDAEESSSVAHAQIDEGVAMTTVEASPKSTSSSVICASPSSGIGSVTSHGGNSARERTSSSSKDRSPRKSDASADEIWNEVMDTSKDEITNQKDAKFCDEEERLESEVELVVAGEVSDYADVDIVGKEVECRDDSSDEDAFRKTSVPPQDNASNLSDHESEDHSHDRPESVPSSDQTPTSSRNRFSSFKPSEPLITNADSSPSFHHRSSASSSLKEGSYEASGGKILTSEEFQRELRKESAASSSRAVVLDGDTDEIVTSPLPVEDLAKGHKGLKTGRKSRFSWGSSNKKRGFFGNFFSSRRTSTRKSYSLDEEQPQKKRRWGWLGLFRSSSSPSPRTRFSLFKSRKKRSHDLRSTTLSDTTGGAYSVFKARDAGNKIDPDTLKPAASFNDVSLRQRDAVDDKPRPVSFMTFQRISDTTDDEDDDNEDKLASFQPSSDLSPATVLERESLSSFDRSDAEASNDQLSSRVKADSDNDIKPYLHQSDDVGSVSSPSSESNFSGSRSTKKRKAPPPPPSSLAAKDRSSDGPPKEEEVVLVDRYSDRSSDNDNEEGYESVASAASSHRSSADNVVEAAHEEFDDLQQMESLKHGRDDHVESRKYDDVDFGHSGYTERDRVVGDESSLKETTTPPDDVSLSSEASKENADDLASQIFSTLNIRESLKTSDNGNDNHDDASFNSTSGDDELNEMKPISVNDVKEKSTKLTVVQNATYPYSSEESSDEANDDADDKNVFVDNEHHSVLDGANVNKSAICEQVPKDAFQVQENKLENYDDYNEQIDDNDSFKFKVSYKENQTVDFGEEERKTSVLKPKDEMQKVSVDHHDDIDHIASCSVSSFSSDDDDSSSQKGISENTDVVKQDSSSLPISSVLNRLLNGSPSPDGASFTKESEQRIPNESEVVSTSASDFNSDHDLKVAPTVNGNSSISDRLNEEKTPVYPWNRSLFDAKKSEPKSNRLSSNIPPSENFSASKTNHSDLETDTRNRHFDNNEAVAEKPSVNSSDSGSTPANGAVSPASLTASSVFQSNSDQVPDGSKPKRDTYYNLIAPRLFGQKWEKKTFSPIKPPIIPQNTEQDETTRRSVIKSVPYPTSHRSVRPPIAPKPNTLK